MSADKYTSIATNGSKFPIFIQLILIIFLVMLGSLFVTLIIYGLGEVYGLEYLSIVENLSENSPVKEKNFIRLGLCLSHIFTFILPALIFLWLVYKKRAFQEVQLSVSPLLKNILLGILFLIASFPVAQFLYSLNQQISLPQWALEQEAMANDLIKYLLNVDTTSGLFFNILTIAFLPAIGEELVFRGIIQNNIEKFLQNPHVAVWVSALIFSAIHMQFQGFLPRVFLGAVLGYLLVWTRNLWIPIIAHFVNNAGQILMQHLFHQEQLGVDLEKMERVPIWLAAICFLIMVWLGAKIGRKSN